MLVSTWLRREEVVEGRGVVVGGRGKIVGVEVVGVGEVMVVCVGFVFARNTTQTVCFV